VAISVVQKKNGTTVSGSTVAGAFTSNTTTGNTIIVVSFNPAGTITVSSIALSTGSGSFSKVVSVANNSAPVAGTEIWAAANITGGTTPTVTITYSGTATSAEFEAYEVSGLASSVTTDGTATASVTSFASSALSCGPISTTNANDLLVAGFSCGGSASSGEAGWTATVTAGTNLAEYIIETSTGSYTATGAQTAGDPYTGVFATFKASSGGATNVNGTVSITGKATLTEADQVLVPCKVNLAGKGTLTVTARMLLNAVLAIAGHSSLSDTAQQQKLATVGLQGLGQLTLGGNVFNPVHNGTVGISGKASLALTASIISLITGYNQGGTSPVAVASAGGSVVTGSGSTGGATNIPSTNLPGTNTLPVTVI
jgi:hypothetical protein